MFTILAVGEDFNLMKTRAEVLRKTGSNVLCCTGGAALKFMAEWEFDLIILCHSVQHADAVQITDAAHGPGSKTKVLQLVSHRLWKQQRAGIKVDAITFVEPDCLVRSVTELLNRRIKHLPVEMPRTAQMKLQPVRKRPQSCPADIAARRTLIAHPESHRTGWRRL